MGEFGQKFRKARETKRISLDDVSKVTKISSRMLHAIEEEDFDQLPGGIFNKGFIRAYARHLGLNDEEAVTGYLACLRQAQIDATSALQSSAASEPRTAPGKPSPPSADEELSDLQLPRAEHVCRPRSDFATRPESGIPWRLLAVAALVIVLALILWTRHSRRVAAKNASPVAPQSTPAPVPVPAPSNPPAAPAAKIVASERSLITPINPPASKSPTPSPRSQPQNPQPQNPQPQNAPAQSAQRQSEGTLRPAAQSPPPAVAKPLPLTLVIRAKENSWISISADGQSVSEETLIAPAHTSIHATREIVAKVGNAAGVTFQWNGQEIPAQGAESEVKTLVFDANGMHVQNP